MKRHPFDPWSFVFGALFLITGLAFLTDSIDLLHTNAARLWPLPVLAIGLLIVLTSVRRATAQRSRSVASDPEATISDEEDPISLARSDPPPDPPA